LNDILASEWPFWADFPDFVFVGAQVWPCRCLCVIFDLFVFGNLPEEIIIVIVVDIYVLVEKISLYLRVFLLILIVVDLLFLFIV